MTSTTDLSPLSWNTDRNAELSSPRSTSPSERVSRATPPRGFKFIRGTPTSIRFGGEVPTPRGRTYAQKLGLRYEQKIHDILGSIYGETYAPSPAILFEDRSGLRRAIPDGILRFPDRTVIVEVKYTHCEKAWWQLNRLYAPLILRLIPLPIFLCEIVHSFDPDVAWPLPPVLSTSLHKLPIGTTGVIEWKL